MLDSLEPILRQLTMIDTLFALEDPQLHAYIAEASVLPYYCLSWVITWCSHDMNDLNQLSRLFDLFLCSNPLMPLYFSAALVLSQRDQILQQECETSVLHSFLIKLPQKEALQIESLISKALELEEKYPPLQLQTQSNIGLDKVSTVNTYETLWVRAVENGQLGQSTEEARMILAMKPEEREPIQIITKSESKRPLEILQRLKSLYQKDTSFWTALALGAGMGTMLLLLSNNELVREWITAE